MGGGGEEGDGLDPHPGLPPIGKARLGEGEQCVWMKKILRIQDNVAFLPHFRSLKWGRQEGVL